MQKLIVFEESAYLQKSIGIAAEKETEPVTR